MYLPPEIVARIAHFADIDTRKHMLFPPRKLKQKQYQWLNDFLLEKKACQYHSPIMSYMSTYLLSPAKNKIYWFNYNYEYNEFMIVTTQCVHECRYIEDCLFWNPAEDNHGSTLFVQDAFGEKPLVSYHIKSRGLFAYVTNQNVLRLFGEGYFLREE